MLWARDENAYRNVIECGHSVECIPIRCLVGIIAGKISVFGEINLLCHFRTSLVYNTVVVIIRCCGTHWQILNRKLSKLFSSLASNVSLWLLVVQQQVQMKISCFQGGASQQDWSLAPFNFQTNFIFRSSRFVAEVYGLSGLVYGISTACASARALISADGY